MATLPTATQEEIACRAREIARDVIGPRAVRTDRDACFRAGTGRGATFTVRLPAA